MTLISTVAVALTFASSVLARTDLVGCTSTDLVIKPSQGAAYASRLYYVPDTGEVCDFLDCGGGRAPPKTTVPGCPLYSGTETYSPSFINPKTLGNAVVASSSTAAATSTTPAAASSSASSAPATSTTMTSVTSASGTQSGSSSAQITTPPSSATSSSGNNTAGASSSAVKTKDTNAAGAIVPAIGGVVAAFGAAFALL